MRRGSGEVAATHECIPAHLSLPFVVWVVMSYPASDGRDRVHGIPGLCGRSHLSSLQPTFHQSDYHTGFAPIDTGPLPGTSSDDPRRPRVRSSRLLSVVDAVNDGEFVGPWATRPRTSAVLRSRTRGGRSKSDINETTRRAPPSRLVSSRLPAIHRDEHGARLESRVPFDSCRPTSSTRRTTSRRTHSSVVGRDERDAPLVSSGVVRSPSCLASSLSFVENARSAGSLVPAVSSLTLVWFWGWRSPLSSSAHDT